MRFGAKPAVLVSVVFLAGSALAGCGGGGSGQPSTQTVQGAGFRFVAPAGWTVTHTRDKAAAASGNVNRVEVTTFKLARRYDVRHFRAATRELDGVASELASELHGQVTARRTVRIDGRKARSYVIAYGGKTQEIAFLLTGLQEHQLLCRRPGSGDDAPCRALFSSFVLR